jgi:NodT family efflux transporter outer membrane factor (OMF) lipoprotein
MSCQLGTNYKPPFIPEIKNYSDLKLPKKTQSASGEGGKAQYLTLGQDIPAEWWKLFHCKSINELVKKGLENSATLEAAKAALQQSQEIAKAYIGSTFYPNVNAQLSGNRERISNTSFGAPNTSKNIFNLYNTSINVSYTLDVFGAGRATLEGLYAQIDYQKYLWHAAYLSLTANIVTTAITEASLRAQIKATEQLIKFNTEQLNIVKKQFDLGGASRTDVLSQEAQLAAIRATLSPLAKSLTLTRHSLAVLVGELPSENKLPNFYLNNIKLPTRLPISLPSSLLLQRPDIRASEALLHQASTNIGVATANLYPQITLTGNYGTSANTTGALFKANNIAWDFGSQLLQPIFNAGALRAKQKAAIQAYKQVEATYKQTVLQAFQNVADSLRTLEMDAETLKAQTEAEIAARSTLDLVKAQYKFGAVNYLVLLNAEQQFQIAVINKTQAQAARYADTAALFQALGGGWWNQHDKNK